MTDKQTISSILKKANIEVEEDIDSITLYGGYVGFYGLFTFDTDGTLLKFGAYE